MASVGPLRRYASLILVAALGLALAGLGVRNGLALFSGQVTNAGNTFTTASCFSGDTGWLSPGGQAAASGGDGDGFEVNPSKAFADGGGKVYWADQGTDKIQRANLDGNGVEDLVTSGLFVPLYMELDVSGGKMYWTDADAQKIQRANLDGSGVEDLVTGLSYPSGIALDVGAGKMYWTDAHSDKIQRADLDGSGVEDLVTGLSYPNDIALDVSGGKMYWTDPGSEKIQRASLDGSGVEDLVSTGVSVPVGIALDVGAGKMYWEGFLSKKIQRANLDGSGVEDLVTTGLDTLVDIALDVGAGKMYWTDGGTDKIQRADLDGSGVEDLVTGLDYPTGIAVDGGYAINNDGAGDRHLYYDYGISVSPDCSISGIEVRLDWWLDSTLDTSSMTLELSWDGGASWTGAKTDTTESTSEHTAVLGGSTDTWGRGWTLGELSDANFRVRVTSNSDSGSRDFFLDWVPVRVYYAPP